MDRTAAAHRLQDAMATVVDSGDYRHIDDYFTSDYADHSTAGDLHGTDAFTQMLDGFRAAMPGFRHDLSDITFVADDLLIWQVHFTGTFAGEFMGTTGDGRPVELWVANAARLAPDGRLQEHWGLGPAAMASLLEQMGIDASALAPAG